MCTFYSLKTGKSTSRVYKNKLVNSALYPAYLFVMRKLKREATEERGYSGDKNITICIYLYIYVPPPPMALFLGF